jgi:hypothetical protein
MNREHANEIQRKYIAKRKAEGWRTFTTLLPEEVYADIRKYKQLRIAEWTIRQLKKG